MISVVQRFSVSYGFCLGFLGGESDWSAPGELARRFSAGEVKFRVQQAHSQDLELGARTPAAFLVEPEVPEVGETEPPSDVDPVRRVASFELTSGNVYASLNFRNFPDTFGRPKEFYVHFWILCMI